MHLKWKMARKALLAAGVSVAAIATVGMPGTAAYLQDDEKVVEEKKPEVKRTVRVITSGKPVIVKRSRYRVGDHTHENDDVHDHEHKNHQPSDDVHAYSFRFDNDGEEKRYEETLATVKGALEKVEKRLKKSKRADKKALEAARNGLAAALEELEKRSPYNAHFFKLGRGHHMGLANVLNDVEIFEGDAGNLRVELLDEMRGLRGKIAEAMDDVDIQIDLGDNLNGLRIESLRRGGEALDGHEEERLEALKRAEESLKTARERLEKHLAEKKAKEKKDQE